MAAALLVSLSFHAAAAVLAMLVRIGSAGETPFSMTGGERVPLVEVSFMSAPSAIEVPMQVKTEPLAETEWQPPAMPPSVSPLVLHLPKRRDAPIQLMAAVPPATPAEDLLAAPGGLAPQLADTTKAEGGPPGPHNTVDPSTIASAGRSNGSRAAVLRAPKPNYPPQAIRDGIEGTVLLAVRIEGDGKAADVQVVSSSGHSELDAAAVRAVSRWMFQPATVEGRPVASVETILVRFKLED